MSNEEGRKSPTKSSIINYVENFIEKRDNELRTVAGDDNDAELTRGANKESIFIQSADSDFKRATFVSIIRNRQKVFLE